MAAVLLRAHETGLIELPDKKVFVVLLSFVFIVMDGVQTSIYLSIYQQ